MSIKTARADVEPVRQRTQYSCMSASMAMCLRALGYTVTEDEVNRVMGARPMQGAAWEQALACAQHYGCRATLTMPATVAQLRAWTDQGIPVMIGWNPEGRPWSHASVVFDVDGSNNVHVADPNIPNPTKTVRVVPEDDFYGKWYEKFPDYLVRRPACAIEREITVDGRQVRASTRDKLMTTAAERVAEAYEARMPHTAKSKSKKPQDVGPAKKDPNKFVVPTPEERNPVEHRRIMDRAKGTGGSGGHQNRERDVEEGRSRKEKHKKPIEREAARPGPHWNPWPDLSPGTDLNGEIELLEWQVRHPQNLQPHLDLAPSEREGDKAKTLQVLPQLVAALKAGDRTKAQRALNAIPNAYQGLVGQPVRHFIRDGITRAAAVADPGWAAAAKKLLDSSKELTEDGLHYRAYLRAFLSGNQVQATHLAKKFPGSRKAQVDLIDLYGTGRFAALVGDIWQPASGGGWKYQDNEIRAYISQEDAWDYVPDRNIPSSDYFADPELTADGIPELMEQYRNGMEAWRKFTRQGWWPKPVKTTKWRLYIDHLPSRKTFEADFNKSELNKAKTMGAQAIEVIRGRKYPRWMTPKFAALDSRYRGNPDGKPVKPHVIDHGIDQPLSGGTDVMQQLQNELLEEQGRPQRPDNPRLAGRCSSNSSDSVERLTRRYLARCEGEVR